MVKADFKHITELYWNPFICKNYFENKHRILVISVSNYKNTNGKFKEKQFTNYVVNEYAIEENNYSKLFSNFHKVLFGNMPFVKQKLWNNLTLYYFIQTPMESNKKKSSFNDFFDGWVKLFKMVETLKAPYPLL